MDTNGANGMSDIEGKAVQVTASESGEEKARIHFCPPTTLNDAKDSRSEMRKSEVFYFGVSRRI